jgi:ubiquinone/menaquinone biosynthesis C-methylase UbiE
MARPPPPADRTQRRYDTPRPRSPETFVRDPHLTELMDDPAVDPRQLDLSLRFIRRVNRYLGGIRAVRHHLERWSRGWPANETVTFLDVATGSADIPIALARWAERAGHRTRFFALDLHETTLALARRHLAASGAGLPIQLVRGDALVLPFADGSVDYVLSSMFFHHLPDALVPRALAEMVRVARRGVIVNDLLRGTFARVGIHLLTLWASPIDKHDARVSVKKAWSRREVEAWAGAVGAPWLTYREHWASRFTLAGEKPAYNPR